MLEKQPDLEGKKRQKNSLKNKIPNTGNKKKTGKKHTLTGVIEPLNKI